MMDYQPAVDLTRSQSGAVIARCPEHDRPRLLQPIQGAGGGHPFLEPHRLKHRLSPDQCQPDSVQETHQLSLCIDPHLARRTQLFEFVMGCTLPGIVRGHSVDKSN